MSHGPKATRTANQAPPPGQKNLTQTQLAKILDTHYVVIGRYENNKAIPSVDQLASIADKLNVTADWLLFGDRPARHLSDFIEGRDEAPL